MRRLVGAAKMAGWKKFPHDDTAYRYPGNDLKKAWRELHAGDCEPWPDQQELQQAWRCFHRGEFHQAVKLADQCGIAGHAAANKATGVYATYLEDDEKRQAECFQAAIRRAEKAIRALPDDANSHYFHAFNLGRYSQSISVVTALKQGFGGKIAASLHRALELQPRHAEAHTALGMYHAEIIGKVGKLIGSMTYGASEKEAIEHFETALGLTPASAIAHIEYGNGIYLLYGERRLDDVADLYQKAAEMMPRDAMEKLDVESALAELE
jgi:tetratricopeptide (TPR) repeat protein